MRRSTIGLGLALAAVAVAAPAHGATLSRSGSTVTYVAASGEENIPTVGFFGGNLTFNDGYDIATGAGCGTDPVTARTVCAKDGVALVSLRLGDRDDEMKTTGPAVQVDLPPGVKFKVDGGAGKDRLIGTKANDVLSGGPGADNVFGSGGKDNLIGGSGNDRVTGFGTLDGGPGNDFLEAFYGFGDKKPFASKVFGGSGKDHVLTGNKVHDVVDCGAGKDVATTSDRRGFDRFKSC
jgi:RTX calcium-binding nonapeptide repeat (4 copies)